MTPCCRQSPTRMSNERIVYFFVEGSIAAGKTTLLERIAERLRALGLPGTLVVVKEPIAAWRNVGGHNVLDRFYAEPSRWALAFQTHAMATRVAAIRSAIAAAIAARKPGESAEPIIVLCERSVYTDRHVFVELLHADGTLSDMERALYEQAYDYYVPHAYPGKHGGVIYLRSDPDACVERMRRRDRTEEAAVALAYLVRLHEAHERALTSPDGPVAWGGSDVLTLDVERLGNVPDDDGAADDVAERVRDFIARAIV